MRRHHEALIENNVTTADDGRGTEMHLSRRGFLAASALAITAGLRPRSASAAGADGRVIVGAHPWVYAATQPGYDIYPVLDQIFADVAYAGIEGLELMHTALHPADSVERISALMDKHHLPVIGSSYGGAMWDRGQTRRSAQGMPDDHSPAGEARAARPWARRSAPHPGRRRPSSSTPRPSCSAG